MCLRRAFAFVDVSFNVSGNLGMSLVDMLQRFHYRRCNQAKIALTAEHPEAANDSTIGFRDLTDQENIMFRYSY